MYNPWGYYIRKESGMTERLSLFVPKLSRKLKEGFSGGTMVKNLPANAGDMSSIPDLGRSHMLQSNEARVPQLLNPCSRARKPTCHNY